MDPAKLQPHIHLYKGQVTPVVLVVGDPARALSLAQMCDQYEELAKNREYHSYKCVSKNQAFTVISHGIGSAGSAICFEELISVGAKLIIRVGTAGSLQPSKIHTGDVVICLAAAREDGVSKLYAPPGLPAMADPGLVRTMMDVSKEQNYHFKHGVILTCDVFYDSPVYPSHCKIYSDCKVDMVDMEMATLFIIASMRGIKAGGVCCIDGCPLQWDEGNYDPKGVKVSEGIKTMIVYAIECAVRLTEDAAF